MSDGLPKPLLDFFREQCDSVSMLVVGFSDYVASRACLRFNCLFQAAILGEQAIEKAFKAGLRLSGDRTRFKNLNHGLLTISGRMQKAGWFDCSAYKDLIGTLDHHFRKSRYPPTSEDPGYLECGQGLSREQFGQLDRMILDYYDALPVPDEVKFSLGVYGVIHNKRVLESFLKIPSIEWDAVSWENAYLKERFGDYAARAGEYFDRLVALRLPGLVKVQTASGQEANTATGPGQMVTQVVGRIACASRDPGGRAKGATPER